MIALLQIFLKFSLFVMKKQFTIDFGADVLWKRRIFYNMATQRTSFNDLINK